jgi:hypothetical protein
MTGSCESSSGASSSGFCATAMEASLRQRGGWELHAVTCTGYSTSYTLRKVAWRVSRMCRRLARR